MESESQILKLASTLWFARWNGPVCGTALLNYDASVSELVCIKI